MKRRSKLHQTEQASAAEWENGRSTWQFRCGTPSVFLGRMNLQSSGGLCREDGECVWRLPCGASFETPRKSAAPQDEAHGVRRWLARPHGEEARKRRLEPWPRKYPAATCGTSPDHLPDIASLIRATPLTPSSPAHAGDPVFRGVGDGSEEFAAYWLPRSSRGMTVFGGADAVALQSTPGSMGPPGSQGRRPVRRDRPTPDSIP